MGLHKILELLFEWIFTVSTKRQLRFTLDVSPNTVEDWLHACRMTVGKVLELEDKFVKTETRPIQVDEAKVDGSAKHNKGRRLSGDGSEAVDDLVFEEPDSDDEGDVSDGDHVRFGEDNSEKKWVVGISLSRKHVRFVPVPNRTSRTILAIISRYCAPGSVIHTDEWRGFSALSQYGFVHKMVIHDHYYVDPNTGAHTQVVERMLVEIKACWRRSRGICRLLQSHIDEVAWRALHRDKDASMELLHQFLDDIKKVHTST